MMNSVLCVLYHNLKFKSGSERRCFRNRLSIAIEKILLTNSFSWHTKEVASLCICNFSAPMERWESEKGEPRSMAAVSSAEAANEQKTLCQTGWKKWTHTWDYAWLGKECIVSPHSHSWRERREKENRVIGCCLKIHLMFLAKFKHVLFNGLFFDLYTLVQNCTCFILKT